MTAAQSARPDWTTATQYSPVRINPPQNAAVRLITRLAAYDHCGERTSVKNFTGFRYKITSAIRHEDCLYLLKIKSSVRQPCSISTVLEACEIWPVMSIYFVLPNDSPGRVLGRVILPIDLYIFTI